MYRPVGLGFILVQGNESEQKRVVACASKPLKAVEQRYSQTEREALAIVWSCEHFQLVNLFAIWCPCSYFHGIPFLVSSRNGFAMVDKSLMNLLLLQICIRNILGYLYRTHICSWLV
jgi:hypothetical protein